ncbi:MAG TPA: PQQ-binding-like beta-propeller repeat protein, partial [Verrucomicrobiae bacterium]|nr:PQQ-binding-like beta-propeller repeat protein [Verrucomicrobiae bacterium]
MKELACALILVQVFSPSFPIRAGQGTFTYFRSDSGLQNGAGALPDDLDAPESLRWRVRLDPGHSSPVLRDGKIFLTSFKADSKQLTVVALNEATGTPVWHSAIVPEHVEQTHPIGSPATATPACDGERLFVFFGSAGLFCYDLEGKKLWEQHVGPFR